MSAAAANGDKGIAAERTAMLEHFYRAFNERDLDAFLEHLAPGVELPDILTGEPTHGRGDVRGYWQRQWREIDPSVEPMRINFDSVGTAHVLVDQLIRSLKGEVLQNRRVEHIIEFEGAFIRRLTVIDLAEGEVDDRDDDEDGGEGEGGPGGGEAGE